MGQLVPEKVREVAGPGEGEGMWYLVLEKVREVADLERVRECGT